MQIATFGPFIRSHLKSNLDKKLLIFKVVCKAVCCKLQKNHISFWDLTYGTESDYTHTDTTKYI